MSEPEGPSARSLDDASGVQSGVELPSPSSDVVDEGDAEAASASHLVSGGESDAEAGLPAAPGEAQGSLRGAGELALGADESEELDELSELDEAATILAEEPTLRALHALGNNRVLRAVVLRGEASMSDEQRRLVERSLRPDPVALAVGAGALLLALLLTFLVFEL
ncbi:MAG: hypothetical protein RBU37_08755 [Myxococcota bacterium]|jgi:hypothetical protein|nr:hypothetical protein [Myxococcota bacterium]